ncbi:hypothetical protein SARC_08686, partial [Sphaeroforma arctica JP610]
NPWVSYYEDEELKQEIEMDVLRTYQEMPFFQQESVQASLGKLLFVFSKEFAALSYRQGMHELLAPLLWVRTHHTPLTGLGMLYMPMVVKFKWYTEAFDVSMRLG